MTLTTFLAAIGPGGQLMLLLSLGVPLLLSAVLLTGRAAGPTETAPPAGARGELVADR